MNGAVIETRGPGMRFDGVQAVRGVNFTLAERELRCAIGPNGAGINTQIPSVFDGLSVREIL